VGTYRYMPPEQRRGAAADPRADLYAAGLILFETLVGSLPGDRAGELAPRLAHALDARLELPAPLARALGGRLADPLTIHLRALVAEDPGTRPTTPQALAAARGLVDLLDAGDEPARLEAELAAFTARAYSSDGPVG